MDAPKRIGLVHNGLGGWRLWSVEEPGMGGVDTPDAEYIIASEHDRLMAEKAAEIERLRKALIYATAHLFGAASAYEKYACRSKIEGRGQPDPFFKTRLADFNNAADRARAALGGNDEN